GAARRAGGIGGRVGRGRLFPTEKPFAIGPPAVHFVEMLDRLLARVGGIALRDRVWQMPYERHADLFRVRRDRGIVVARHAVHAVDFDEVDARGLGGVDLSAALVHGFGFDVLGDDHARPD